MFQYLVNNIAAALWLLISLGGNIFYLSLYGIDWWYAVIIAISIAGFLLIRKDSKNVNK